MLKSGSPRNGTRGRLVCSVLVAFAALVMLTGCGDDESSSPEPSSDDNAQLDQAPNSDREGETIKVGYVNQDNGTLVYPDYLWGGKVAIEAINAAGGINGAQIEVVECSVDGTPDLAVDCANQLVEAGVVLAYTGIDVGADAALPVYSAAGIPFISTDAWGQAIASSDDSFLLNAAPHSYAAGPLSIMAAQGLDKIAIVHHESAAGETYARQIAKPLAEELGFETTVIGVSLDAPDWQAAVATAQAAGADMIYGQLAETGCSGLVGAATDLAYDGIIFAGSCSNFIDEYGDAADGIYTIQAVAPPKAVEQLSGDAKAAMETYIGLMEDADKADLTSVVGATSTYEAWMKIREVLSRIDGTIDAASIRASFDEDEPIAGVLGPTINCGGEPPSESQPSSCSDTIAVFQAVVGDGGSVGLKETKPWFRAGEVIEKLRAN